MYNEVVTITEEINSINNIMHMQSAVLNFEIKHYYYYMIYIAPILRIESEALFSN